MIGLELSLVTALDHLLLDHPQRGVCLSGGEVRLLTEPDPDNLVIPVHAEALPDQIIRATTEHPQTHVLRLEVVGVKADAGLLHLRRLGRLLLELGHAEVLHAVEQLIHLGVHDRDEELDDHAELGDDGEHLGLAVLAGDAEHGD